MSTSCPQCSCGSLTRTNIKDDLAYYAKHLVGAMNPIGFVDFFRRATVSLINEFTHGMSEVDVMMKCDNCGRYFLKCPQCCNYVTVGKTLPKFAEKYICKCGEKVTYVIRDYLS